MRNYLGLSSERDKGYAYVIVLCASIWSGLSLGYMVNFQLLTAEWKASLDLPFQTAALHSLFFIFGRYSSTILATALLDKYSIRFWTILSISCLVGSYILVFFTGYYATRDNFVYIQVIFGLLNGIGTGTGWTCCNVVSQQWLDQKRAELNPYLLLGAPIVSISSLPLFNWLCQTYTWSGACLISAGITLNCVIVILLFVRNMDHK